MTAELPPTLIKALLLEETHSQQLREKVGKRIKNYNACAACGKALYADIYGNSESATKFSFTTVRSAWSCARPVATS